MNILIRIHWEITIRKADSLMEKIFLQWAA